MDERIIDLSEEAAGLSVALEQLCIRLEESSTNVPLEDIAALIISHPAVHLTQAVLAGVCSKGGSIIICNEKRLPIGMLLPLTGNYVQTERFSAQTQASMPTKKRLWQQVVRNKVQSQAAVLTAVRGEDHGLRRMSQQVRSGDAGNVESRAARVYWRALFGEAFRRVPGEKNCPNNMLNYGYAVLRGLVARAIAGSGLHPSLGLHHHNRYNPFCLADDLMEPFRPLVDKTVFRLVNNSDVTVDLGRDAKAEIIKDLMGMTLTIQDEDRKLFDVISRLTSSLAAVFLGSRKTLILPSWRYD